MASSLPWANVEGCPMACFRSSSRSRSWGDTRRIAHRVDARHLHVRLRAVACATPDELRDNSVGGVDEVGDRFQSVGIPGLAEWLPLAYSRSPTASRASARSVYCSNRTISSSRTVYSEKIGPLISTPACLPCKERSSVAST
jgi:hypothetical protein